MVVRAKKAKIATYKDKSKLGGMVKVYYTERRGKSYRFKSSLIPSEELNNFTKEIESKLKK